MFEVLQKHIQDQVCESLAGSDEVDINTYEDKDNSLKNMVISHSKVKYSSLLIVVNLKNKMS